MRKEKQQPQKNKIGFFLLILLLSGCVVPEIQTEKLDFNSGTEKLNLVYAETGLTEELIEKIESNKLLPATEQLGLNKKLDAAEKRFVEERALILQAAESEEKNALLALVQIHLDKIDYLHALVELKNEKEFEELSALIESFDFNSFQDGVSCADFQSPKLKPQRIAVKEKSLELENKIDIFENTFKPFAGKEITKLNPKFKGESIVWLVQSGEIIFESCEAITNSIKAIGGLREAAQENNLCLAFGKLDESVSNLEETAAGLSVFSDSPFIESLGLDQNTVSEGQKGLVLIASEFRELTEQLKTECE